MASVIPCASQAGDWCEPNGTITTAFRLDLNQLITASINTTTDRYDYYRVNLNNVQPYTATLRPAPPCAVSPPGCDLGLFLYTTTNPITLVVQSSSSIHAGNEQFVYTPTVGTTGDYVVLVYAWSTTITPTQYTLIVK